MIIILFFFFLLLLLLPFFLSFRWRLKTCGEPCSKFNDIFHGGFTLVHDHGKLQVVDKLLVEQSLVLKLMEKIKNAINKRQKEQ